MYSWEMSHQRHSSTKLPEEGSREPYSLWVVLDTVHCSGHGHCGSQSLELTHAAVGRGGLHTDKNVNENKERGERTNEKAKEARNEQKKSAQNAPDV